MSSTDQHPMVPELWRIQRVRRETYDTFTVELASANGRPAFPFAPGQFNMLYVFGVGEVPISISGEPAIPETLVHTTRAVGTVTKAMNRLRAATSWECAGHSEVIGRWTSLQAAMWWS